MPIAENLLDYGYSHGQIRKGVTYAAEETPDLDMNQTASQVTTYGQAGLPLLDVLQFLVEKHCVSFFSSARLWSKASGFCSRWRHRTIKNTTPARMLAAAAKASP